MSKTENKLRYPVSSNSEAYEELLKVAAELDNIDLKEAFEEKKTEMQDPIVLFAKRLSLPVKEEENKDETNKL